MKKRNIVQRSTPRKLFYSILFYTYSRDGEEFVFHEVDTTKKDVCVQELKKMLNSKAKKISSIFLHCYSYINYLTEYADEECEPAAEIWLDFDKTKFDLKYYQTCLSIIDSVERNYVENL